MSETIINGIDVSECEHHYTNPVNGTIYHGCAIYEQVNELGYSQDTLCEQNPDCYFKQLKRLQEENEELKKRCEELDKMTGIFSARLAKKYKQALEEIRDIAKYSIMHNSNLNSNYQIILQKINEVLKQ
jgi:predicted RNase H-like nuclease (RuvC/YqgF family)